MRRTRPRQGATDDPTNQHISLSRAKLTRKRKVETTGRSDRARNEPSLGLQLAILDPLTPSSCHRFVTRLLISRAGNSPVAGRPLD